MAIVAPTTLRQAQVPRRLDAQFFLPAFTAVDQLLSGVRTEALTAVCSVSDGNHAKVSHYFAEDPLVGPRYLRGQDIGAFFLGDGKSVYIPPEVFRRMERSQMMAGDVLLSIVGTIGALSLVPVDAGPLTGSCKIAILRPSRGRIPPEYLAAFLASRYGQLQVRRWTRGAVQTGFILADARHVRICRLGALEERIADVVRRSYEARLESREEFRAASRILEEELGMPDWDRRLELSFGSSLAALTAGRRWDAGHFRPRHKRLEEALGNTSRTSVERVTRVRSALRSLTNGHTPLRHDLSTGDVKFLTAEDVSDFRIEGAPDKRVLLQHHTGELARTALTSGDVLVTIKGRVGNCAVVDALDGPTNINQDVALIRLRPDVHPYFFAAWFNSPMGKVFVDQHVTGGINPFLGLGTLEQIPYPVVGASAERRIGDAVRAKVERARALEMESDRFLQEAIRLVEEGVEEAARVGTPV